MQDSAQKKVDSQTDNSKRWISELWCYSLVENKKTNFAQNIIPTLDAEEFKKFEHLFEIIDKISGQK